MQFQAAVNLLSGVQNGGLVTVEKEGDAKLRKTGNPLRDRKVVKHSRFQIKVGCSSQSIENAKAKREGRPARIIGKMSWGEYVANTPIIEYKGNHYLRGYWFKNLETTYTVDGQPATDDQLATIREFTPKSSLDKSSAMTIKLDGIKRLTGGKAEVLA